MGNCIICGAPVDGQVCSTHEEDVAFEFEGDSPDELTPNRYYKGTVDGFADFGVFVDIGDSVTGLLHRSELDQRLDSLGWDAGDEVYVKVKSIRDNGDIDLGWSIRQSADEFRGTLVDTPRGDVRTEEGQADSGNAQPADAAATPNGGSNAAAVKTAESDDESEDDSEQSGSDEQGATDDAVAEESATEESAAEESATEESATEESATEDESNNEGGQLNRTSIDTLDERVGDRVRLEGEVVGVRQTSGPTIFELRDESGVIECAAFEEAGVRAYPEIEIEDAVRLHGEVKLRREDLQVETETLVRLEGEEADAVQERLRTALDDAARPDDLDLLADNDAVAAVRDDVESAATAIRRAILEARPIVVRHSATADGYAGGAAIERAALPLIREEHSRQDAVYNYFQRRPIEGHIYDMDAATGDVTDMLEDRDRHGDQLPLVVLVDAGSTVESNDGYDLLDVYDVERVVVDAHRPDEEIADSVDTFVNPHVGEETVTTPALAANVAAAVNPDVREELLHVPAVGYWESPPEAYVDLAAESGYDEEAVRQRREAIALEAYYQTYKDKRELIADLLFEEAKGLAGHVSGQFRTKLGTEVETAERNLTTREASGVSFAVLDTDAYTHRFDFPTTTLLVEELHRRQRDERGSPLVTLGVDEDEIHVRSTEDINAREIGQRAAERADEAGVSVVGGRDGHVEFLAGQRDHVLEAVVAAVATELSA